ncbi:MAG: glycoside hydrolase, partial [Acidilobaceae archaeon]
MYMWRNFAVALLIAFIATTLLIKFPSVPYSSTDTISIDGMGYDWKYDYCIALSGAKDQYQPVDYYLDSRDLIAFYFTYNNNWAFFRVDLLDISYGAEVYTNGQDGLNIYVLMGWTDAPGYQQ